MNKKIFSGGIFMENLRRAKLFAIITAILIVIFEAAPVIINVMDMEKGDAKTVINISSAAYLLPVVAVVAPVFLVMLLFAQFNKRSYSDFAHALPYTRKCIYITNTVSVYSVFIALLLLAAFAGILGYALFPSMFVVNLAGFWKFFLIYFSAGTFVISAFQIAVSLTGTVFSNITAAGLLLFFPRFILYVMTSAITSMAPFLGSSYAIPLLSPYYNTLVGIIVGMGSSVVYGLRDTISNAAVIYTLLASLVYTVVGFVVFTKRKSETAEAPAPGKKVQSAIRVLVALVFSVPATALIVGDDANSNLEVIIIFYALALVAYFAYEAITAHTLRNLSKTLPALLVAVLANLVCAGVIVGISNVAISYTPAPGEIDAVCVGSTSWRTDNSNILPNASGVALRDASAKGIVSEALKENVKAWNDDRYHRYYTSDRYVELNVTIVKNGFKRFRTVYFTEEQYTNLIDAMSENKDYQNAYMDLPEPIPGTLSIDNFDDAVKMETELIASLEKEIGNLGFEKWYKICEDGYNEYIGSGAVSVYYVPKGYERASVQFAICSEYFPETYNLLLSGEYKNQDNSKLKAMLDVLKNAGKDGDSDRELCSFNIRCELVSGNKAYSYFYDYLPEADYDSEKYGEGVVEDKVVGSSSDVSKPMKELFIAAAEENTVPTSDSYLFLSITAGYNNTRTGEYDDERETFFLPLPKGYNPDDNPYLQRN